MTAAAPTLTRRQREALAELREKGHLWAHDGRHARPWSFYNTHENGAGYSHRTLYALVEAGLAEYVSDRPGVMPYFEVKR